MRYEMFWSAIKREHRLLQRKKSSYGYTIFFYSLLLALFPLSVGIDPSILRIIAAGVIWISALLAILLGMMNAFQMDDQEGVLELLLFSNLSLERYVVVKVLMIWLHTILPLIVLTPCLGLLYGLTSAEGIWLSFALALGSLSMSFIVALGGALTLGLCEPGLLLALLVFPFVIPLLMAGGLLFNQLATTGPLWSILTGFLILSLGLGPRIIAQVLRLNLGGAA